jgi:hypothetical protein
VGEVVTTATSALFAIWGAGPNDVFAVGGNGAAVHFDGATWTPIDIGVALFFSTVWGTGPADVHTTGQGGVSYRWDGANWNPVESSNSKIVNRVFGVDGRVFAVGDYGTILELAGGAWTHMAGGLTVDLEVVWVSPRGDALAVGDSGTILRLQNGVGNHAERNAEHLRAVHGMEWNDAIAVENGTVLRSTAARGRQVWRGRATTSPTCGCFLGDVFAVGDAGLILRLKAERGWILNRRHGVVAAVWARRRQCLCVGAQSALNWNGVSGSW